MSLQYEVGQAILDFPLKGTVAVPPRGTRWKRSTRCHYRESYIPSWCLQKIGLLHQTEHMLQTSVLCVESMGQTLGLVVSPDVPTETRSFGAGCSGAACISSLLWQL